jgi:hypothetical protein
MHGETLRHRHLSPTVMVLSLRCGNIAIHGVHLISCSRSSNTNLHDLIRDSGALFSEQLATHPRAADLRSQSKSAALEVVLTSWCLYRVPPRGASTRACLAEGKPKDPPRTLLTCQQIPRCSPEPRTCDPNRRDHRSRSWCRNDGNSHNKRAPFPSLPDLSNAHFSKPPLRFLPQTNFKNYTLTNLVTTRSIDCIYIDDCPSPPEDVTSSLQTSHIHHASCIKPKNAEDHDDADDIEAFRDPGFGFSGQRVHSGTAVEIAPMRELPLAL